MLWLATGVSIIGVHLADGRTNAVEPRSDVNFRRPSRHCHFTVVSVSFKISQKFV